ncbi:hypothetical protein [Nonomuraea lactucae]|uniref:hypothetical protein n=1 Tax=Nonomuraea lactucae TaxID=2249762 RepID=UPI0013B40323|nr:hypothetical protein [Nonomuraea lactucae]
MADVPGTLTLSVVSEEVPGKLKVKPGRASFRGFHYVLDTEMEISYSLNSDTSQWRADLVVLRLDRGTNKLSIALKEGTVGGSRPNPDTDGPSPEMALAYFNIPPNSAAVPANQVVDLRTFVSRRIRVSAKGAETFPDGTIFYNVDLGRFYAKIRERGATTSEIARVPRFREVIVHNASDSSDYPADPLVGTLVWDEALQQLLIQTSWTTPTWAPVGGSKMEAIKRRGGDLAVTSGTASTADTILTIPIDRTGSFQFEAVIFYRIATAGATCSLQVTTPPLGASGRSTVGFEYNNGSNTASLRAASITANATLGPFGAPAASTNYSCRVYGSFINTGSASLGSLGITYLNPSGNLTIVNGTYLTVRQV